MSDLANAAVTIDSTRTLSLRMRKRFATGFALAADFDVLPGITMLFGPSGAGKTTILQCVAGLLSPDEGRISIGGSVFFDGDTGVNVPVVRRNVGYVFQDLALFPHLTVEQNVGYGLGRMTASERRKRVQSILELFGIAQLGGRRPGKLSGGERQRTALARSLVTDPQVLLLDEPLAALDLPTRSAQIADLRRWNQEHRIPILYVTHSQREVFALGERVVVLENGEVLAQGSPQQVLRAPRQETVAQLAGFENVFEAQVVAVHEQQGTMTCRIEGSEVQLEVPLGKVVPDQALRIAVSAEDILLATQRPQGLSARNLLPGTLVALKQQGVTVHAEVDCGVGFQLKLTPSARESLALAVGREVWLVIKTYSCHLLELG